MAKDLKVVSTKIPPSLHKKVEEEIASSRYINTSDFVRQAIRNSLNEDESDLEKIIINKDTHNKLMEIGKKTEDFDDVLQKLIEERNGGGGDY